LSWYEPKPRQLPKRLPRRRPIKVVPSGIGDKGIVGNWLFYYLKGGDHLHDFSPYKNHGTINGAKWVDGRYGWSLKFDGADDWVEVSSDASLNPASTDRLTVSGWFKADSAGSGSIKTVCRRYNQYLFRKETSDDLTFYIRASDGSWYSATIPDADWEFGVWYFFAGVYDGENVIVYLNDTKYVGDAYTGEILDQSGTLGIGADDAGANNWNGLLAELRIYDTAKSTSWINRRFQRTKSIFGL